MRVVVLQPPSPPGLNVKRDLAGGLGVADPSPRTGFGHDPHYITMPSLSLLYVAGVLERLGHAVSFVDGQLENLDKAQVVERVRACRPDLLVQLLNLPSLYADLELLEALRAALPGVTTVAVGTVTIPLDEIIVASGAVDAVIRGDAEVLLPSLLGVLERGEPDGVFERREGVWRNRKVAHVADLDALSPVPYHLIPLEKYWYFPLGEQVPYASMFASRGCSFHCYYCPYPMGFGNTIVHRDPVKVADEIEELYRTRGVRAILFRDQVFTMDRDRTLRLCDELIRRNLRISWVVETRLDRIDEPLVRRMKEAGCVRMHFGIESGDAELFKRMGKDGVEGTLEDFLRAFSMVERVGVAAHMFILVGLLGESWQSVRRTIETVRRMKPITLQVAVVTPYPGTGLFKQAERKGLLTTLDLRQYTGFVAVSRTEHMSAEDLQKARDEIIRAHERAVFWKRKRWLVRLAVRYVRDGSLLARIRRRTARSRRSADVPAPGTS
jgi:radical SAM superfamily enzyme YgiQ (UPF0313 family)